MRRGLRGGGGGARSRKAAKRVGPPTARELDRAARFIQGLFRVRNARRRLRLLTRVVFEKVYDPETGSYFYHNKNTGDVSWEKPLLLGSEEFDKVEESRMVSPHERVTAYRALAKAWQVAEENGSVYYYNSTSRETVWEKPQVLKDLESAVEERDEMLGQDWEEVHAPDAGGTGYYFFNKVTTEASWTPPKVDFRKTKKQKEREAREAARKARLAAALSSSISGAAEENDSPRSPGQKLLLSESDDDDEPPEAIAVGLDGKVDPKDAERFKEESTDDDTVYVSTDDEEQKERDELEEAEEEAEKRRVEGIEQEPQDAEPSHMTKREMKRRRKRRDRRRMQLERHLSKLESLHDEDATDQERHAYELRCRMKRAKKRKSALVNLCELSLVEIPREVFTDEKIAPFVTHLDVGLNKITHLPYAIKRFRNQLVRLSADSCMLLSLPVQLWYCTKLVELDLRNNRLGELSREKGDMTVLREMNLWEIGIETLINLERLLLDNNELRDVPEHVCGLQQLRVLSVRNNRLSALPSTGLEKLQYLRHIDVTGNFLDGFPERCVSRLPNLETLLMSRNNIVSLPDDIGNSASLRVLDCSFNLLKYLPVSFTNLSALQVLNMRGNALTQLVGDWAGHMSQTLRVLDLSSNKIQRLPESLGALVRLQHLDVSKNCIKPSLPSGIALLAELRSLRASENELEAAGFSDWSKMTDLVSLDLSRNVITKMDASVLLLAPSLSSVNLSRNKISEFILSEGTVAAIAAERQRGDGKKLLPAADSAALERRLSYALETLDVSHNDLDRLVKEIFTSTRLVSLDCSENRIAVLPSEVECRRSTLRSVNLDGNRIKSLPNELINMERLHSFSVNCNQLAQRPAVLEQVASLRNWHANNNPISYQEDPLSIQRLKLCQADLHLMRGHVDQALALFDYVLADLLSIEVDQASSMTNNEQAESRMMLAAASMVSRPLLEHHGPEAQARAVLEEVLRKRGAAFLAKERYAEASRCVDLALAMHDRPTAQLLLNRAVARLRGLGNPRGAVSDLDAAILIDPTNYAAYRLRAAALIELGHFDKALSDASVALEFDMFDVEALLYKGVALQKMVKLDSALDTFKDLISICETDPAAQDTATQGENPTESGKAQDSSESPESEQAVVHGEAAEKKGKETRETPREESNAKSKAISPWSPHGIAYYRLGLIFRDLGKAPEAVVRFQTAAEILYGQIDKAREGSLRRKQLSEVLRLSVLCKSSALQSMNRAKKAMDAYRESRELEADLRGENRDE